MKCLRCGNEDSRYFCDDRGVYYCRRCVMFGRVDVGKKPKTIKFKKKKYDVRMQLDYELTPYQKAVTKQVQTHINKHHDVLVYAATGAGKTEIVMPVIEKALRVGKKVGIAISRRQVVLEICERMQKVFPSLRVIAVCEGHTRVVDGDLIVCTMHQLYRYEGFDLLICDEVDAFPYYGNPVLEAILKYSCKKEKIYLTATPDEVMKQAVKEERLYEVSLFVRPHGKPLVVPKCYVIPSLLQYLFLYIFLKRQEKEKGKTLVFVPTIHMAEVLASWFRRVLKCSSFTSKTRDKDLLIEKFRNHHLDVLFSTTILERGITVKGVDVAVLCADHIVFSEASLVQIFGRVGRSMDKPYGKALLLCSFKNEAIKACISSIQMMNREGGF